MNILNKKVDNRTFLKTTGIAILSLPILSKFASADIFAFKKSDKSMEVPADIIVKSGYKVIYNG